MSNHHPVAAGTGTTCTNHHNGINNNNNFENDSFLELFKLPFQHSTANNNHHMMMMMYFSKQSFTINIPYFLFEQWNIGPHNVTIYVSSTFLVFALAFINQMIQFFLHTSVNQKRTRPLVRLMAHVLKPIGFMFSVAIGYLLMLIVMTYNFGMFMAMLFGNLFGHVLFNLVIQEIFKRRRNGTRGGSTGGGGGGGGGGSGTNTTNRVVSSASAVSSLLGHHNDNHSNAVYHSIHNSHDDDDNDGGNVLVGSFVNYQQQSSQHRRSGSNMSSSSSSNHNINQHHDDGDFEHDSDHHNSRNTGGRNLFDFEYDDLDNSNPNGDPFAHFSNFADDSYSSAGAINKW